jgi:NitT/TauT family transport system substrate-binding protein
MTRITRRRTLGLLAGAAAAPLTFRSSRSQSLDKVSHQTGWRAQAEQGGFYQAVATGIYKQYGLDVEIKQGGPQLDSNSIFLSGRADFIDTNSFAVMNYVREGLPGISLAAILQKDARVLLSHPGVGNDNLEALKGKTILVATAGRTTYWQWLKAKYGYTEDQARPYTFNMAPFLADKSLTMQGLITSEPFAMRKQGIEPVIHLLADLGFDNYQTIILGSPKMVKEKPELVQRYVDATIKGWSSYLTGDPSPGNALIKKDNPDMTDDMLAYAIDAMKKFGLVVSGDTKENGIGAMTEARWKRFYDTMVAAGAQPAGLDVTKAYTLQFTNKKIAV